MLRSFLMPLSPLVPSGNHPISGRQINIRFRGRCLTSDYLLEAYLWRHVVQYAAEAQHIFRT